MPFTTVAKQLAADVGSPWAFLAALGTVVVWSATGPFFYYSDTWQLFINTGTTIVTFLMVFLIQNTQNATPTIHLKLDELIRSVKGARNTDRSRGAVGRRTRRSAAPIRETSTRR